MKFYRSERKLQNRSILVINNYKFYNAMINVLDLIQKTQQISELYTHSFVLIWIVTTFGKII